MRHMRFRPPPITTAEGAVDDLGFRYDALQLGNNPNLMLDHLSVSWGSDEVVDLHEFANDSTLQWSTIEVSNPEGQPERPHNDGMIVGPDSPRVTIHHSLFAHHEARCPAMATGPAELLNTVVYDCKDAFVHHNAAEGEFHIAGNTFIQGPNHEEFTPLFFDDEEPGGTTYWLSQNDIQAPGQFEGVVDDISDTPLAEAAFFGADPDAVIDTPSDFSAESDGYVPVGLQTPADAYEAVLESAGAFPRDGMSRRTIDEVRNGTGTWDPDPPDDLLEGLTPTDPPPDDDADGMADDWELEHGLDPNDGDDHASAMPSGYTAIEEYVNELSDFLVGAPPSAGATPSPSASGDEAAAPGGAPTPATASSGTGASGDGGGGSDSLGKVALGVAVLAVALSGASLYLVQRRTRPQSGQ
jgi:pectate lyase